MTKWRREHRLEKKIWSEMFEIWDSLEERRTRNQVIPLFRSWMVPLAKSKSWLGWQAFSTPSMVSKSRLWERQVGGADPRWYLHGDGEGSEHKLFCIGGSGRISQKRSYQLRADGWVGAPRPFSVTVSSLTQESPQRLSILCLPWLLPFVAYDSLPFLSCPTGTQWAPELHSPRLIIPYESARGSCHTTSYSIWGGPGKRQSC